MKIVRFLLMLGMVVAVHYVGVEVWPPFAQAIDLFLILTVLNALDGNSLAGMLGGLAAGFVQDALSGGPFGLHGFILTLVGYVTARVAQRLVVQRASGVLSVVVVAFLGQQILLVLLGLMLAGEPELPEPLWVSVRAVVTGVVGAVAYAAGVRLARLRKERRRRRSKPLRLG